MRSAILSLSNEDEQVFLRVKTHKERFRQVIRDLVAQTRHRGVLDNDTLTDALFLLLEGGIAVGAMFRSSEDAEKARHIAEKLL